MAGRCNVFKQLDTPVRKGYLHLKAGSARPGLMINGATWDIGRHIRRFETQATIKSATFTKSRDEDEFLHVEHHVAEVGPGLWVVAGIVWREIEFFSLLVEKCECRGSFLLGR
jgi:hypothetical protein